ncbi:hypothetical protein PHET_00538 [Paragonimus heterotremus]|uniref:Uncharacterized protein n=1 Tax=Paragonimus heterotremus TaxID=100268 RepID=A0A8J4T6S9_9TREM|nr:hypothetical protein PHET_00538 [Paragonimus heterotremus]
MSREKPLTGHFVDRSAGAFCVLCAIMSVLTATCLSIGGRDQLIFARIALLDARTDARTNKTSLKRTLCGTNQRMKLSVLGVTEQTHQQWHA